MVDQDRPICGPKRWILIIRGWLADTPVPVPSPIRTMRAIHVVAETPAISTEGAAFAFPRRRDRVIMANRYPRRHTRMNVVSSPFRMKTKQATESAPRRPPKQCPRCTLISPPSTLLCECGYDFKSGHDSRELETRAEAHFYWMGIGGLMSFVGVVLLASGTLLPWFLVGGFLVFVRGFLGWRDARIVAAENDKPGEP